MRLNDVYSDFIASYVSSIFFLAWKYYEISEIIKNFIVESSDLDIHSFKTFDFLINFPLNY